MKSAKLQDVLGMVLSIGNVMNEGTRTGGAAGFRFDSLLRLTQTKTSDGKITVLDYLVTVFVAKGHRETLDLMSDFPDIHTACRLLISDMKNEVDLLQASLSQCKTELADLERDQAPSKAQSLRKSTGGDSRSQLFASIKARGADKDGAAPKTEGFAKRDKFLAAIQDSSKKEIPNADSKKPQSSPRIENSLEGGLTRLRNFIDSVQDSLSRLEKQKVEVLKACADLSTYCGESGGVGSTMTLLGILSQFVKNVGAAVKKYDERQKTDAQKPVTKESKDLLTSSSEDESEATQHQSAGTSLVLMVNDVLKNANPRLKKDFKKGRVLVNPTSKLKAIYERERSVSVLEGSSADHPIDIVSFIQQRNETIDKGDVLSRFSSPALANSESVAATIEIESESLSVKERALQTNQTAEDQSEATSRRSATFAQGRSCFDAAFYG